MSDVSFQQYNELIEIEGSVCEIIYTNDENGYTICVVEAEKSAFTAAGYMPFVNEGEIVKLTGRWTIHPEYGEQFSVQYYEKMLPESVTEIYRYLASGAIKGIRSGSAKKIVDQFGASALEVILNFPEKLSQIKGISAAKAAEIGRSYASQLGMQRVLLFLQKYGVGPANAIKIYRRFGSDALSYIKTNPYSLCNEIEGISFKTSDSIALDLGFEKNNSERIMAGIQYILYYNANTGGHTYLTLENLVHAAAQMLEVDIAEAERGVRGLAIEKQIHMDVVAGEDSVFAGVFYHAERNCAAKLLSMNKFTPLCSGEKTDELIEVAQKELCINLAPQQIEAIFDAIKNSVFVITGGPGTGKTTIVNVILSILSKLGQSVVLTAPTGRAAKRLTEVTGREAKTIHRLLEIGFSENSSNQTFCRDENHPLDEDVVIVDEMSMVDILLFGALMKALKPSARLILVGDVDQLPSVGAGNVLADIIDSKSIPIIRLTEIFRQAAESMIVTNAHRINSGDQPILNQKDSDFFLLERHSATDIVDTVLELCSRRLPNRYQINPFTDIQVLSPMKKGEAGVISLNKILQKHLNPSGGQKREKQFGHTMLREGDKVMQIKNNYNLSWTSERCGEGTGVFNGDIGYIQSVDEHSKKVFVLFDDERQVCYDFNQTEELELAYAVTVHKSQGSEFKVVVMPVYHAAPMLMKRNLFYTALTRAKELVVLVGKRSAVQTMVDNNLHVKRFTALCKRLQNGG